MSQLSWWIRVVVVSVFLIVLSSGVSAVSVVSTGNRTQLSSSPDVVIRHGWTGGGVYDMTFEVLPDCSTRPVRLMFPDVDLVIDPASSASVSSDATVTTASIWTSYEKRPSRRYPVRAVVQQDDLANRQRYATTGRQSNWTDYVELAPGKKSTFRIRFDLPPMELDHQMIPKHVPETITLTIDHLDLGCSVPLTLRRSLPFNGRETMLKLGPRAE